MIPRFLFLVFGFAFSLYKSSHFLLSSLISHLSSHLFTRNPATESKRHDVFPRQCLSCGHFRFSSGSPKPKTSPQDYLNAHNSARSQVGVSNIAWKTTLAAYALNYANSRKADCTLVHSVGDYGENLSKGTGSFTCSAAVALWVAEKPNYDYISNSCINGPCLHYTQVVWRDSVVSGVRPRVQCNNGWWLVSCNYDPPGKYLGEYPY